MNSKIKQLEIVSTSTCMDFFSKLKKALVDSTNFELLEESISTDELHLTFDTKMCDFKLKIATKETSSATSNAISCTLYSDTRAITRTIDVKYGSASTKSTDTSQRKVILAIHECDKSVVLKICGFNEVVWSYNFNYMVLGKLYSKLIADNTEHTKIWYGNTLYDAQEITDNVYFSKIYNASNSCAGVVKQNVVLTNSVNASNTITSTIKEYCTNLYCCSTLTSGFRYKINDKTYFAFDSNILVEE